MKALTHVLDGVDAVVQCRFVDLRSSEENFKFFVGLHFCEMSVDDAATCFRNWKAGDVELRIVESFLIQNRWWDEKFFNFNKIRRIPCWAVAIPQHRDPLEAFAKSVSLRLYRVVPRLSVCLDDEIESFA